MNLGQAGKIAMPDQWFRYWMPYHFVHLEDSRRRHVYLPVNRNYKPLGTTARTRVDYQDFLSQAMLFSADPATFDNVWMQRDDGLWLYDDNPRSRVDYFARLERLMSRSIKLSGRAARSN